MVSLHHFWHGPLGQAHKSRLWAAAEKRKLHVVFPSLLWQDKTCPACTQLVMSCNAIMIIIIIVNIIDNIIYFYYYYFITHSALVQGVGQGADVSASAHTCSGEEHC